MNRAEDQTLRGPGPIVMGFVIVLYGLPLLAAGGTLARYGGSWFFMLAGALASCAGGLLILRKRSGLWIYGAMLAATLVSAFVEVGISGWQLLPRLFLPMVLGAALLFPWARRGLS